MPFNGNPFGLVYEGALTENAEGAVNIHAISYPLRDITVAANVYHLSGVLIIGLSVGFACVQGDPSMRYHLS